MKIYYYKDSSGNFGDDLNAWLWPKLFPDMFDGYSHHAGKLREQNEIEKDLFIGIGTLLNNHIPAKPNKWVFGSGTGYAPPPTIDNSWHFYFVRGPLTCKTLGIDTKYAITDSGALVRTLYKNKSECLKSTRFGFMPHCQSAGNGNWEQVCEDLNIKYIDPRNSVDNILESITSIEVLLTEAMHGAIVADALRVPWVPLKLYDYILDYKWQDWCLSLDLTYTPYIVPSLWDNANKKNVFQLSKSFIKKQQIHHILKKTMRHASPILSKSSVIENRTSRMLENVEIFKTDHKNIHWSN